MAFPDTEGPCSFCTAVKCEHAKLNVLPTLLRLLESQLNAEIRQITFFQIFMENIGFFRKMIYTIQKRSVYIFFLVFS
ncbi:MAG: hypothetical protein RSF79_02000, partial [Janthinobacterium sp.]